MNIEISTLNRIKAMSTLREFLSMSVFSTDEVFAKFNSDIGGNLYEINGHKFYYKPGSRPDKILLVAHADTVWDKRYRDFGLVEEKHWEAIERSGFAHAKPIEKFNAFYSGSSHYGLGADDRAGAAIAYLLKDSGNSILITDCEEIGALSARNLMEDEYFKNIINSHRYMLQFDLEGKNKFKCYSAGSDDFKAMMEIKTKCDMLPNFSFTDISVLGSDICGANLATGYHYSHTPLEFVSKKEWFNCYKIAKKLSKSMHQQFYVDPEFGYKYTKHFDNFDSFEKDELLNYANENQDENFENLKEDDIVIYFPDEAQNGKTSDNETYNSESSSNKVGQKTSLETSLEAESPSQAEQLKRSQKSQDEFEDAGMQM